jgi:hypothetical protein
MSPKIKNKKIIKLFAALVFLILFPSAVLAINSSLPTIQNPFDQLEVSIPGMARFSEPQVTQNGQTIGITNNWIAEYILGVYNYGISIIGIFAVLGIAIGGVLWIMSMGNPSRVAQGKEWIMSSIMGLALALGSYLILNTISPGLVNFGPINTSYIPNKNLDLGDSNLSYQVVSPDQVNKPYSGQDNYQTCPAADLTGLANYYAYSANPPLTYSESMRWQQNYCDCSSFSQHLAICAKLNAIAGEGSTAGMFISATNNRRLVPNCDNPDSFMRPGDVFGYNDGSSGHVLTYLGGGQYIECGGSFNGPFIATLGNINIGSFKARCQYYANEKLYYINR